MEAYGVRLELIQGDITRQEVDAIVNAANSGLMGGGGVDGAIHQVGGPAILEECKAVRASQGRCPTGKAVITGAGLLPARFVIHTVGPVWRGGDKGEAQLLRSCYTESLTLAARHGVCTIAFPSISTGAYGYPINLAAREALGATGAFLRSGRGHPIEEIRFVVFSLHDYEVYRNTMKDCRLDG